MNLGLSGPIAFRREVVEKLRVGNEDNWHGLHRTAKLKELLGIGAAITTMSATARLLLELCLGELVKYFG
jgi:hypothetical protein